MKSSAVFLAAASGLLAACNPSPEDFGPQRKDVMVDTEASNDQSNDVEQIDYTLNRTGAWGSQIVIEFRPQGGPDALCVLVTNTSSQSNAMQCWKAPAND